MKRLAMTLRISAAIFGIAGIIGTIFIVATNFDFLVQSAFPPGRTWSQYSQSDVARMFIDTNSINESAGIVEYTILIDYKNSVTPAKSAQITAAIDCRKKLRRVVNLGPNFSEPMASGSIVCKSGPPSGALESSRFFQSYDGNSQLMQEEKIVCV